jgi:hypothetical protein
MALRHREAFEQFVWSALRRAYNAYYDAMEQELGPEGVAQWVQGDVAQEPLLFTPPLPEVTAVVQREWTFQCRTLELIHEWDVELSPEPLGEEVGEIVLQLAPLATMDPDKRLAMLLNSAQWAQLMALGERYCQLLRDLDQVNPRPNAEALRGALLPPWPPATTKAEPPATRKASARR